MGAAPAFSNLPEGHTSGGKADGLSLGNVYENHVCIGSYAGKSSYVIIRRI